MKYYNIDLLSDIDLEMTPLTEDQEGNLRGGFVGIEGGAGTYDMKTNNKCSNGICTNNSCYNKNCKNTSNCPNVGTCANESCNNTNCPDVVTTTTNSRSIIPSFEGLIL